MEALLNKARRIKCLICDIDGVMTDGLLHIDNHGNELKAFHVHDGVGLKLLMAAEIDVAVITGSINAVVDHRMNQLGIRHYFKGQIDKKQAYHTLKTNLNLKDEEMAYIGDDVVDLPIMQQVGFSIAVANAVASIKNFADWTTKNAGGQGGIREVCDFILTTQNKSEVALHRYLNGTQADYCA